MIAMLFILFNDTDLNVTTMNLHLDRPTALQDMRSTLLKGLNWNSSGTGSYMVDQFNLHTCQKKKCRW